MEERKVIGLVIDVEVRSKLLKAKIDTGAERSSIDLHLAKELGLGPTKGARRYRNVHAKGIRRPLVESEIIILGKTLKTRFNLADRTGMNYKVLIGNDLLKQGGFLIDPLK